MALLLLLAFILMPILEIYLIVQVGQTIGVWWTIGLLVGISVLGTWLVRREGRRAWRSLQEAIQNAPIIGRTPDREVLDAGLILVGGTLLLTPGFATDALGLVCIVPFLRPLARSVIRRVIRRRLVAHMNRAATTRSPHGPRPGQVIQGEVVDRRDP